MERKATGKFRGENSNILKESDRSKDKTPDRSVSISSGKQKYKPRRNSVFSKYGLDDSVKRDYTTG